MPGPEPSPLPAEISDFPFPVGEYRITRETNDRVNRLSGLPPSTGHDANPLLFSVVSLAGLGISIEKLCALCDFDYRDAPMVGGCRVHFATPLKVDQTYDVHLEILSLERKTGRKIGAMDLLKFNVNLIEKGGSLSCQITYTWILPREKSHAKGR